MKLPKLILYLLVSFFCFSDIYGQNYFYIVPYHSSGRSNGAFSQAKRLMAGGNVDVSYLNNRALNQWFENNGYLPMNKLSYSFNFSVLYGISRFMSGFELGIGFSPVPKSTYGNVEMTFGMPIEIRKIFLIPSVNIGYKGLNYFSGNNPVSPSVQFYNNVVFDEDIFYIKPNLKLLQKIKGTFYMQYEIGCAIYLYRSNWEYMNKGSGKNISYTQVPFIPKASEFSPYVSVFFGGGRWEKWTKKKIIK